MASLGIEENAWLQCRTVALALAKDGFIDPISILYTSFKCFYSSNVTLRLFTRWLLSDESNKNEFAKNSNLSPSLQTAAQLLISIRTRGSATDIDYIDRSLPIEQIWIFIPISIRLSAQDYTSGPEVIVLDNNVSRVLTYHRKNRTIRSHCFFAVTPSGKYSNQLHIYRPGRHHKLDYESNSFARIVQSNNGQITADHLQQWLEDFLAQHGTKNR